MTYQSPKNDIPTTNGNSNSSDENISLSLDPKSKLGIFTEINASFNYIHTISDPVNREYELIQESKRLDIPLESYRRLLEEYIKSAEISELDHQLLKSVKFLDQRLGDFVAWCQRISIYKLSLVVGQATLLLATGSYFIDGPQRQEQALNDAKKLILDNANFQFNQSRIKAFEFLNQNCTEMTGIQAPKAYMPNLELNKCYKFNINFQTFFQKPIIFHYQGVNLSHANLAGANLEGANLAGANFNGANLEKANLIGANLEGANLEGANLKLVDIRRANLQDANLTNANMQNAFIGSADLKNANLTKANLSGSQLFWTDLSNTELYRANLSHTFMSRVNLQGADLYDANLEDSILSYADLQNSTDLRRTKLKGVNFKRAYFSSISQLKRGQDWEKVIIDPDWEKEINKAQKIPKIALIMTANDSMFQSYLEGIKSVSGVEVIAVRAGRSVEQEAKAIADLIKQEVDGIIVNPQDPEASVPAMKKAFKQGIIVINIGDCINNTDIRKFVFSCYESDSIKMGYDSTQAMLKYMKRKYPGQVINVGLVDGARVGQVYPYLQGFKQAMAKSGVQWQEVASTDAIDITEISKIKQMLQTNPSINVIWSGSDTTTRIAVQAIQELGLGSKIKVFGIMDPTPEKLKMLQDPQNALQSLIDESPTKAGKGATERILQVLKRKNLEYEYHLIPHKLLENSN
ncbi:MAG: pentapeptide repeat-containing protein [Nostocales cyanobacterium ELA583]|jgi:uncharacterized protein YjbI with pentapeptide repeats/ABC-type sugar transport system substrate-binding protein